MGDKTINTRDFGELSDEMLYGYVLGLLDAGYLPAFMWRNKNRRGAYSATFRTEVDPDELDFPDHASQVKARNCGWLSPEKIQYVELSSKKKTVTA